MTESNYITQNPCKEEGKDQELIQLNTRPDSGHHMEKCQNTRKHHIRTREQRGQPFPSR